MAGTFVTALQHCVVRRYTACAMLETETAAASTLSGFNRRATQRSRSVSKGKPREGAMLGESHDLMSEFPEFRDRIETLRSNDGNFARLMTEYDQLDARIRRIEEFGQRVADTSIEELKKQRLSLKDALHARLRNGHSLN